MALTYSEPVSIGMLAPEFPEKGVLATDGKRYHLKDFERSRIWVMIFMCNHCPYVKAVRGRIRALSEEFKSQGVQVIGVNSNDSVRYPDDDFASMKREVEAHHYDFPYLWDETQEVAKSYGAVCTPDFFVFDRKVLKYRGRLDDNWKDESQVKSRDLARALGLLLSDQELSTQQTPSMGCSIKWK